MSKQFVIVAMQPIMETDSYLTAQALQSDASTPSEISAKFGTISYSKGKKSLLLLLKSSTEIIIKAN